MLIGATVKSVDDLDILTSLGFDFGEVLIPNSASRRLWWESGIKNNQDRLFLIAHGPLEDPCDDVRSLWDHYVPTLKSTVDTAARMGIRLLTVHLTVNGSVSYPLLDEKQNALKELVDYGLGNNVLISLENVTESAEDLAAVLDAVHGLGITLDVGHAHLVSPRTPSETIRRVGTSIRHVHLHDNDGYEDLHLPVGEGMIDFSGILRELADLGYDGTLSLELPLRGVKDSKIRLQALLEEFANGRHGKGAGLDIYS